ncbi:MAG: glycoside hydrolase family 78 protein [Butyrivibrio sp.]|nr:glycoside hydrolase family 78 protein [Butyrivibrio sp.]
MKGRIVPLILVLMLGVCIALSGCGPIKDGNKDNKDNRNSGGAGIEAVIPEVHKYDNGMSMAHYISAPSFDSDNDAGEGITNYEISYRLALDNTSACFVIGDKKGEYGELILCELTDHGVGDGASGGDVSGSGAASLTLKRFENGIRDQSYDAKIAELTVEASSDHVYDVLLEVQGKSLLATVNGQPAGAFTIPGFELGCVGTYKSRGTSYAYIDDLIVTSEGKTLLKDDFDGHFENNLYEYDYGTKAISAFSPYYVKLTEGDAGNRLRVSSGFILSETAAQPAPVFRREILCEKKELKHAYLYMTALGSFEARINGVLVSDHFFDPGKMVYDKYLNYASYDVTNLMQDQNTLDVTLFHGFFDRGSGYPETAGLWGKKRAIKGELVLVYKDESSEIIPTDDQFRVLTDSRYRFDDIYHGEIIDDRYYLPSDENASNETGDGDPAEWQNVLVDDVDEDLSYIGVETKLNESIKPIETRDYISVTEPVEGHFVYDFGQNFAGTISFNLKDFASEELKEGQVITFRYGELLNSDNMINTDGEAGTVWTQNLLTARATDYYVVGANGGRQSENSKSPDTAEYGGADGGVTFAHTYHGFRYLEVTGLDKAISTGNIKALVLSSGMEETGTFECSSDIISRFYNNSRYSMRSNLMDVPTDCAQRDERLGWAGDAQAASLFGMYQYDAKSFYENYLKAIRGQMSLEGEYMDVAPFNTRFGGHNCWGDASIVIAWNLYLQYGDKEALKDEYWGMGDWIDYLVETSDNYLRTSGGYGDHLSGQDTIETLTDTAWCAHSARLVSKMAKELGKGDDARKYMEIADSFTQAWQNAYIREDGSVEAGILAPEAESETAYSLGIAFDLFPEDMMDGAKERLKLLTEYGGFKFYPGYSGMPYYLPSLASGGYGDYAVKVLENTEVGGIAHPLMMGLTTNPEELGAFRYQDEAGNPYPEGKYRVTGSLNHAAYSSVCSFLYTDILGIKTDENAPGYEHFFIEPAVNCGLSFAKGSYKCIHGTISVSWNAAEKKLEAVVPEGTTCTIILPGTTTEVESGEHEIIWE